MSKASIKTASFKIVLREVNRMMERQNTGDLLLIRRLAEVIANNHKNTLIMKSNKIFSCDKCGKSHKRKGDASKCCNKSNEPKEKFNRNKLEKWTIQN